MNRKLIIFVLIVFHLHANATIDSLWGKYYLENNAQKVSILENLADAYNDQTQLQKRDSCIIIAFYYLEFSNNVSSNLQICKTYSKYANTLNIDVNNKINAILNDIINTETNIDLLFDANLCKYYLAKNNNKLSDEKKFAERINYFGNKSKDENKKITSSLVNANELNINNSKAEAYQAYLDAIITAKQMKNDTILFQCYDELATFLGQLKVFEKEKSIRQKQYLLINKLNLKNTKAYYDFLLKYSIVSFSQKDSTLADKYLSIVLNYAYQTKNVELKNNVFTVYRSFYISNKDYKGLQNLYATKYPQELAYLQANDTSLYLRVKSYLYQNNLQLDSAKIYFANAESHFLKNNSNLYQLSNFYTRYGELLYAMKNWEEAKAKFQKALNYSISSKYFLFSINNANYLDSIFVHEHNYEKAYYYNSIAKLYADSLRLIEQDDKILKIELDVAEKEKKLQEENELNAINKKHNAEYSLIIILIFISFIVLIILGSIKVNKLFIKTLGYISFIFFFEFIILLTDNWIHHLTEGSPLKILLFKLLIISFLLPFHHWIEEKVVHYLMMHKLVDTNKWYKNILSFYKSLKIKIVSYIKENEDIEDENLSTTKRSEEKP